MLEILSFYTCVPKTTIIWGNEVQFLRYGVKQDFFVILGHFLPFYPSHPQQPRKPKFWKNERSFWRCHHFKLVHQKHDHMMCLLRHGVGQKIFCHFCHFCSFTPLFNPKIKIFKKWKNTWRYHNFIQVYHKWQSNDVSFMRYEVQQNF